MSTAAKVLSPFFYLNYVFFCIYMCCFIANFGYRKMLVSIQSHNHKAYIVIFSFLFTWPLRFRILNELRTKYVVRY